MRKVTFLVFCVLTVLISSATAVLAADPMIQISSLTADADHTLWKWDNTNRLLTLNGINLDTDTAPAIFIDQDVTIEVLGNNTLTSTNTQGTIYANGTISQIKFIGNGTLNVTNSYASSGSPFRAIEGTIDRIVLDGPTLNFASTGVSNLEPVFWYRSGSADNLYHLELNSGTLSTASNSSNIGIMTGTNTSVMVNGAFIKTASIEFEDSATILTINDGFVFADTLPIGYTHVNGFVLTASGGSVKGSVSFSTLTTNIPEIIILANTLVTIEEDAELIINTGKVLTNRGVLLVKGKLVLNGRLPGADNAEIEFGAKGTYSRDSIFYISPTGTLVAPTPNTSYHWDGSIVNSNGGGWVAEDCRDSSCEPIITTLSLPTAVKNKPYSAEITFSGSTDGVTWNISALPNGLTFNGGTLGIISGTPTQSGQYTITVQVSNNSGKKDVKQFNLVVADISVTISGTVVSDLSSGATVSGATVSVFSKGQQITTPVITDSNGVFVLGSIPDGNYQLNITKDSIHTAVLLTVVNGSGTISDSNSGVILLNAGASSKVILQSSGPKIMAGGLSTIAQSLIGQGIVTVQLVSSAADPIAQKNDIAKVDQKILADGLSLTPSMLFDLTLSAQINADPIRYIDSINSGFVQIIIPLEATLQRKAPYRVYRVHKGAVDVISQTANTSGESISWNVAQTEITLQINKFSIYRITGGFSPLPTGIPQPTLIPTPSGNKPPLPSTGFATGSRQVANIGLKPDHIRYEKTGLELFLPQTGINVPIVDVPLTSDGYEVRWLEGAAGLLEDSAMPGSGISMIAAHNHLSTTETGPFLFIRDLKINDRIFIRAENGNLQAFRVIANDLVGANDFSSVYEKAGGFNNPLVLITCENETLDGTYADRRIIYAEPL